MYFHLTHSHTSDGNNISSHSKFLIDYGLEMSKLLLQGSNVWEELEYPVGPGTLTGNMVGLEELALIATPLHYVITASSGDHSGRTIPSEATTHSIVFPEASISRKKNTSKENKPHHTCPHLLLEWLFWSPGGTRGNMNQILCELLC